MICKEDARSQKRKGKQVENFEKPGSSYAVSAHTKIVEAGIECYTRDYVAMYFSIHRYPLPTSTQTLLPRIPLFHCS